MATPVESTPLTFDLPQSLSERIEEVREKLGLKTVSAVVRLALERFDFTSFKPTREPRKQISVRLTPRTRGSISQVARRKQVSAGEILRTAIDSLTQGAGRSASPGRGVKKTARKKRR